jgi:hypothetical protein
VKTKFTHICEYPAYPYSGLDKLLLNAVREIPRYDRLWYLLRRTDPVDKQYRRNWKIMVKLSDEFFEHVKDTYHDLAEEALFYSNPMDYYGLSESDFR